RRPARGLSQPAHRLSSPARARRGAGAMHHHLPRQHHEGVHGKPHPVTYPAPTTTGDCGDVICNPPSGSFFPVGTTTVTCVTEAGPDCSFTVTVVDTTPPQITCPANIVPNAPAPGQCAFVPFSVSAFDTCSIKSLTCTPNNPCFPAGTTTVTCTAIDNSN